MLDTELITPQELAEITGYKTPSSQRDWLDKNGWSYVLNAANRPVVGRYFARMQLAGISIHPQNTQAPAWEIDFSQL